MSDAPRIRIVSDGNGSTTRVYNEDGTEIRYVTACDVRLRAGERTTATLEVLQVAGEINAEVEAIKEKLVPEPQSVLVVKVGYPEYPGDLEGGRMSPITISRLTNRGVDHTEATTVCEGWVSACEPFELTVAEEER